MRNCLIYYVLRSFHFSFICLSIVFPNIILHAQENPHTAVDLYDTVVHQIEAGESPEVIIYLKDKKPYDALIQNEEVSSSVKGLTRGQKVNRSRIGRLPDSVMTQLAPLQAKIIKEYSNLPASLVRISKTESLDELMKSPVVKDVYINRKFRPLLNESLPLINQPLALDLGARGNNTSVAIIDTGVNYTLADFGTCTSPGTPSGCRVAYADDFTLSNDEQLDEDGHGTNVAAIALGVAPDTKMKVNIM